MKGRLEITGKRDGKMLNFSLFGVHILDITVALAPFIHTHLGALSKGNDQKFKC